MDFTEAIKNTTNKKFTENGATAFKSTNYSTVLDFYALAGSYRSRTDKDVLQLFKKSLEENIELSFRALFYIRDIREGAGERKVFKTILKYAGDRFPEFISDNLANIPLYGRWDDLFCLIGTKVEDNVIGFIRTQLYDDLVNARDNKNISLLAKWSPSVNTSSEETRKLAKHLCKKLNLKESVYRKTLVYLRNYLNITECKMSGRQWENIKYEAIPSLAMNKYIKAFYRHDNDRFAKYIEDVTNGKTKINSSVLYPYNIIEKLSSGYYCTVDTATEKVLEAQWKALPNYVEGDNNVIIMADTSGSMSGRPIATSVGLAIYFAERNQGAYHNLFMTFSSNPEYVKLNEYDSLKEKYIHALGANWGMSTNLEASFNLVLRTAIENNVSAKEMPKAIVVISDMEINCCAGNNWSFYNEMQRRYESHGYNIPNIIFWNVNARNDTFLVDGNRKGVQLVSGQSVTTFKNILSTIEFTPYEAMLKVLCSGRYNALNFNSI